MSERAAFLEFRDRPSSESLVRLLQVNQGRVFRLCYHVLHNAHDAEDAAQAALMKIVEEVRRFSEPDEFRRWLYRVSLNAALQTLRGDSRRRAHEARAAMEKPTAKLPDANERLALFEAIAALDDGARGLILERYFEGETLESIAQRTGASTSTVFNKLEEARASLRKSLGGAVALEAWFTASPPTPDLVTGAVLAKIAAGGTIMASKTSIAAVVAFSVIACLGAGTGLVYLLKPKPSPSPTHPTARNADTRSAAAPPKESRAVVDAGGDVRAVTAAKRRILEAFAKHYSKLSLFPSVKKDRSAGMYLRKVFEDKDLKALATLIAEDESGHSLTALREVYESSKSALRHFSLVLLAQGGRPEFESLFAGLLKGDDPVGAAVAAFGLGTIASPAAMEMLAGGFRSSLHDGGKPDATFLHALSLRPATGLPHLVAIAEELVAIGRSTLTEFQSLGMGFPCDADVVEQLRRLAEAHASPTIRMFALRPLISRMRSKDDLAIFEDAISRERDPAHRAAVLNMAKASAMSGQFEAMEGDARRLLAQRLAAGADQGSRMKIYLKLAPEDQMGLARDVLLGKPAEGVEVEKLDAILFEELPSVRSEIGRRMMLDYALKMGVEDCLNPLHALSYYAPLEEERLIEPLIDLVQRVDAGRSRAHLATAIRTLAGFSEEFRPRILPQLENLYAATRKPEVRTAVLEWGFARMGSAGEEVLIKEASAASDPTCRIAAWSVLLRAGAFERKADLQSGAKLFLQAWNPADGVAGASQVQARYYVELFSSIYLKTGTVEDLPDLKKMADKPTLPGADARLLESLGQTATAAVELIEIRRSMN